jgi:hypothetical protein
MRGAETAIFLSIFYEYSIKKYLLQRNRRHKMIRAQRGIPLGAVKPANTGG